MPNSSLQYLFICGVPRSGTTALTTLLNSHPQIAIGMERYKYYVRPKKIYKIVPEAFIENNFFGFDNTQTNILPERNKRWKEFYDDLRSRFSNPSLRYVGDKYPHYYQFLPELAKRIPQTKFLFIYRDIFRVSSSFNVRAKKPNDQWPLENDYRLAVKLWNEALDKILKYLSSDQENSLFFVCYEDIFSGDKEMLNNIFNFVNLDISDSVKKKYSEIVSTWRRISQRPLSLTKDEIDYVNKNRNRELEVKFQAIVRNRQGSVDKPL